MITRNTLFKVVVFAVVLAFVIPLMAKDNVPFKGDGDEVITSAQQVSDGLHFTVFTTGHATHLGEFTRQATAVLQSNGAVTGTVVWTAANGDQLLANLAAGFVSPTTAVGTYSFTGGTGRFDNASGEANFKSTTSDGVHFALTFEGTIDF
jgi:hypothetical protein